MGRSWSRGFCRSGARAFETLGVRQRPVQLPARIAAQAEAELVCGKPARGDEQIAGRRDRDFVVAGGVGFCAGRFPSWMTRFDYRISLTFLSLFFIITVLRIRSNFYKNVTRARVYQKVIFIYLGVAFATLAVAGSDSLYRFSILTVPLAMMFGYYFLAVKKAWWGELLFWTMFGLLITNHLTGN